VDALTISVSQLLGGDLEAASGAVAIFTAASVNTAGDVRLGFRVIAIYAAMIAAGGTTLWLAAYRGSAPPQPLLKGARALPVSLLRYSRARSAIAGGSGKASGERKRDANYRP
jgi:hypothetical protein